MLRFIHLLPKLAFAISVGLFIASLLNDGYYIEGPNPSAWSNSFGLLLLGWIGLASGTLAWLANPALILSWAMAILKRPPLSLLAALAALALMMSFLLQTTVISSEAPQYSRIVGYGRGFWLWVGSAAVQVLGSAIAAMPTDFLHVGKNDKAPTSATKC